MITATHQDPAISERKHNRIYFIKGFYQIRNLMQELVAEFEQNNTILHEKIDALLENRFRSLKDLSHTLYRMPDDQGVDRKKQRIFDKLFGALWHELDKIRDNIRLLEAYAGEVEGQDDKIMQRVSRLDSQVLNAARRDLPAQFRRARRLMNQLVPLFEQILPVYRNDDVVLRSIYFAQEELDALVEPNTVEYFFPLIFDSVEGGYDALIRSLLRTKHDYYAAKVMEEFKEWMHTRRHAKKLYKDLKNEFNSRLSINHQQF